MTDTTPPTHPPLKPHLEAQIRHRHAHATPGPWLRDGQTPEGGEEIVALPGGLQPVGTFNAGTGQQAEDNLRFVAHAHSDIGRLLGEVDRLRTVEAAALAFADEMGDYCSPHNVAHDYAQRLRDRLQQAGGAA